MVLKAKGRLRNSSQYEKVYITQDYAKAIQMERNVLIKAMFLACKKGMNAREVDRNLMVNSNVYNIDNILDNLKESNTLNSNSSSTIFERFIIFTYRTQANSPALLNLPKMFSLSWHGTSSKPIVNFRLFLFCLTCISFLLGVNCFAAFVSSYPFFLLSPLYNHLLECEGPVQLPKKAGNFPLAQDEKIWNFFSSRGPLY